jgi:hypothetical protein
LEGGRSRLEAAQANDMAHWVPHGVLLKLDRCLMAHCGGRNARHSLIRAWRGLRPGCQTG